jgi:hypothetical protein
MMPSMLPDDANTVPPTCPRADCGDNISRGGPGEHWRPARRLPQAARVARAGVAQHVPLGPPGQADRQGHGAGQAARDRPVGGGGGGHERALVTATVSAPAHWPMSRMSCSASRRMFSRMRSRSLSVGAAGLGGLGEKGPYNRGEALGAGCGCGPAHGVWTRGRARRDAMHVHARQQKSQATSRNAAALPPAVGCTTTSARTCIPARHTIGVPHPVALCRPPLNVYSRQEIFTVKATGL